jgi:hypothetical protein
MLSLNFTMALTTTSAIIAQAWPVFAVAGGFILGLGLFALVRDEIIKLTTKH